MSTELVDFHVRGWTVRGPKGAKIRHLESDPINGLTRVVFQTRETAGDGRIGDDAGRYVWEKTA